MTEAESTLPPDLYHRRLLTQEQACELLGDISRVTLWRLTKRKKHPLPVIHIGKKPKFAAEQVLWWRDNQVQEANRDKAKRR